MEIASIKGDEVILIYHPMEVSAEVGQQFQILETPDRQQGLVIQIISNDSLEYIGLQQEMIQRVLEERLATVLQRLNREIGMGEMRSLKIATAKIRKRIREGSWETWDGWIPTRNVVIERLEAHDLIQHILPPPDAAIALCTFNGQPIQFDGVHLNMVNVVTGVKGSGKSHLAKHLVLQLANWHVPVVVFDVNGEYVNLPNAQVLRWGDNFRPALSDVGYSILQRIVHILYPLPENSDNVFSAQLPQIWAQREQYCRQHNLDFTIDITHLRGASWGGGQYVADAIQRRLDMVDGLRYFHSFAGNHTTPLNFRTIYNQAIGDQQAVGHPIIFDMRNLSAALQQALVRAITDILETICKDEADANHGQGRFPFIFFEEAHFYVREDTIVNIITRGRHIGMGSVFVTNTPQELPRTVFRQLDNLFLLGLTHNDDIRNVSNSSFTDEETIRSFATRMPRHHALIIGNITSRYPLVVRVDNLPDNVPASGQTRSTWDRFRQQVS